MSCLKRKSPLDVVPFFAWGVGNKQGTRGRPLSAFTVHMQLIINQIIIWQVVVASATDSVFEFNIASIICSSSLISPEKNTVYYHVICSNLHLKYKVYFTVHTD